MREAGEGLAGARQGGNSLGEVLGLEKRVDEFVAALWGDAPHVGKDVDVVVGDFEMHVEALGEENVKGVEELAEDFVHVHGHAEARGVGGAGCNGNQERKEVGGG